MTCSLGTPDMFAEPAPFQRGSETSLAAARKVTPRFTDRQRKVVSAVASAGSLGMIRDQIEAAADMKTQSVCSAANACERKGWIETRDGFARVGESGSAQQVYYVTAAGRKVLAQ